MPNNIVDAIVHEHLLELVESAVAELRDLMNARQRTTAVALYWPRRAVTSDDGKRINGAIAMDVRVGRNDYKKVLVGGAKKTDAFGVLFVREEGDGVTYTLETPIEVVAWTSEKQRRGDLNFLKEPTRVDCPTALGVIEQF